MSRKTRRNAFHKAAKASSARSSVSALAKAGLSGFTLGSMAIGRSIFAAEPADDASTAPTSKANEPQELQEVVVTGIRASLQRSLDIKQQAVGVVDAVSAEDIGQFPDASIGDALSRIPGVTVNRGSINGMAGGGAPTATGANDWNHRAWLRHAIQRDPDRGPASCFGQWPDLQLRRPGSGIRRRARYSQDPRLRPVRGSRGRNNQHQVAAAL